MIGRMIPDAGVAPQVVWRRDGNGAPEADADGLLPSVRQEAFAGHLVSCRPVLANRSGEAVRISRLMLRFVFPAERYEVYAQDSRWEQENDGAWIEPARVDLELKHRSGRFSEGNAPFLAVRRIGDAAGIAFHLLPAGNWRIRVSRLVSANAAPALAVDLGIADEAFSCPLAAGTELAGYEVLVHAFRDFEAASAELHDALRERFPASARRLPVLYNSWFDCFDRLDVPRLRRQLAAACEVGCEVFVVDAGWYGAKAPDWGMAVGDWSEKLHGAFFGKMRAFADEVRRAGLGFGLWMEPERFSPACPAVRNHPEWFIQVKESGFFRIDLAIPEAYAYQRGEILRLVETYDLVYLKTDMNAPLGGDDSGCELMTYTRLWRQLLAEVHRAHPELVLECCAGGALRTTLGELASFDCFFPSDNVNPIAVLRILHGLWRRMEPGRVLRWIALREMTTGMVNPTGDEVSALVTPKSATWPEFERVDPDLALIAGLNGGAFGFTGDLAGLSEMYREVLRKYIAFFKGNREFFRQASGRFLADGDDIVTELRQGKHILLSVFYRANRAVARRIVTLDDLAPDVRLKVDGVGQTGNRIAVGLDCDMHAQWRAKMCRIELE